MVRILSALLIMLFMALSPISSAYAQQIASKAEAADVARKVANGRVLRVDKVGQFYRVKVLKKSGRVVSVDIDIQTGQVIPQDKGN